MSQLIPKSTLRTAYAAKLSMFILLAYLTSKVIVLVFEWNIPILASESDPIAALLLVVWGSLLVISSVQYAKLSYASKSRSSIYSTVFDHPDNAFEEGKQKSKQHMVRAVFLGSIGLSVVILGISYFLFG